jgi:hypothetical protein
LFAQASESRVELALSLRSGRSGLLSQEEPGEFGGLALLEVECAVGGGEMENAEVEGCGERAKGMGTGERVKGEGFGERTKGEVADLGE